MVKSNRPGSNSTPVAPTTRPASLRPSSPSAARPAAPVARRRWRRFRRPAGINNNGVIVALTVVVITVVLALLAFGYWDSYIRPARAPAVRVGGRTVDMLHFTRRMKTLIKDPSFTARSASQIAQVPATLAQNMVDEEVFVQRAGTLGVSVSDDEIDGFMAEQLRIPFTRDDAGKIQYTPAFENAVRVYLQRGGLTLAEYRRAIHGQRLRQEVRTHFQKAVPEALPAVRLRQIIVADEAKAKEIKAQLDGGADFAQLASTASTDTATKNAGGLRDWSPQGLLPPELDGPAFSLPVGGVSDPIQSGGSYVILKVEERTDSRQISDTDRSAIAQRQLDDWLKGQRDDLKAKSYLDDAQRLRYAIEHSGAAAIVSTSGRPGTGGGAVPPINIGGGGQPGGGAAPGGAPPPAGGGSP